MQTIIDDARALVTVVREDGSEQSFPMASAEGFAAASKAWLRAGWDAVHPRLRLTKPFYDRFTPAISVRDFALRRDDLERALDFVAVLRP